MTAALIGSHGTIGSSIIEQMQFDCVFNSDNVTDMTNQDFGLIVCAAPSGNRLAVNRRQVDDLHDIQQLTTVLSTVTTQRFVLISSVDAVTYPDSIYGSNRAMLENFVRHQFENYNILRLSTLIGKHIKKNVLYDLKHGLFLDKIDSGAQLQWCILDKLADEIELSILNNQHEKDLVSVPVANYEILSKFFPDITMQSQTDSRRYNMQPYHYTRKQIFEAIEDYLK
jgi:hypothetical protein